VNVAALILILVLGYGLVGLITSMIVAVIFRRFALDDVEFFVGLSWILWPLAWILILLVIPINLILNIHEAVVKWSLKFSR